MEKPTTKSDPSTVTGRRNLDLVFFFVILAGMLSFAPRSRVFYQSRPTTVSLVAIQADGSRTQVQTPEPFQGTLPGIFSSERRIREFAGTAGAKALTPEGGKLEWTVHFGGSGRWAKIIQKSDSRILTTNGEDD